MAKYKFQSGNQSVINTETGEIIPFVDENSQYQQYLAWLADPEANPANVTDPADPSFFETWGYIRAIRADLLFKCDWTQLPDSPLTQQQKDDWAAYRQALRDIPGNYATPQDVVWPTPPS
jgi:hypothetical protein